MIHISKTLFPLYLQEERNIIEIIKFILLSSAFE